MKHKLFAVLVLGLLFFEARVRVEPSERFTVRLSPVPVDTVTVRSITGSGSMEGELVGNRLTLSGSFENLSSPATIARVHRAPKGLRGPAVFELILTQDTGGIVEGVLVLSAAQIEDLKRGRFYVQISTQKNADGHLRGWILK
jgi:hypothetical protein